MNVVLIGMMGCGKTTVAAALSSLYGLKRVDTDEIITERYGAINGIFADHGEEYFRNIEEEVTKEVASHNNNAVISVGGGCVLRRQNVNNLKQSGKIFYLRTTAETVIKRLKGDDTRPLLKGGLEERVNSILSSRAEIYEGAADFILDTDGFTPEQLAIKIRELTL